MPVCVRRFIMVHVHMCTPISPSYSLQSTIWTVKRCQDRESCWKFSLLLILKTFDFTGVNVYNMFVLRMQHSFFV